ncbi:hypothetical protein B0G71_4359 [Paraburkholderia sp. BL27I4N3]|uniref:hypothetical protein n=1 Tax=Paraburkholderia sp. BL27I4N3 TaxID=1938805 RepID=UPI000E2643DA|nr:hypothetical protein [Paraburkholderia sp. BL27I4N3]REE21207.1 hypothetical protein B0G71_4359 [Paraburkholderia sp. BL27I4N3]
MDDYTQKTDPAADSAEYIASLPVVYRGPFGNPKTGPDLVFGHAIVNPDSVRGDGFENDTTRQEFTAIRQRFDKALQVANAHPLMPQKGQTSQQYARMLVEDLLPHASPKTSFLERKRLELTGQSSLPLVEKNLIADVLDKPRREGRLADIRTRDQAGRVISTFIGDKNAWLGQFRGPGWRMTELDGVPTEALGL